MILGLLLVAAVAGGYLWLRSWLHSEDFRQMLSNEVGEGLGAKSEFGKFHWNGGSVGSDSFDAQGDGLVESLHADGLRLDIGLSKVSSGVVEVSGAKLNQLDVVLDLREEAKKEPLPGQLQGTPDLAEVTEKRPAWYADYLPSEVRLLDLEVVRSSLKVKLEEGDIDFAGTNWDVRPEGGKQSYRVEAKGGQVDLPWEYLPSLRLSEARLRYQNLMVYLTDAAFSVYESGRLDLSGEAALSGGGFTFEGRLRDVMAAEVLSEDWKQRLEGRLGSEFSVSDSGTGLAVDGSLELSQGILTALPVLDHLAAYGGNPRFRRLVLNDARADYYWKDGILTVSNLELGSDGLIRLEGMIRIDANDRLDGRFKLGLAPGTLERIPGAETKVFLPGDRALLWTNLRITGTVDDPKEDLTDRLIAAAGERLFELLPETGERVLKFTRNVVTGDLDSAVDEGKAVIKQGENLLETGKLLLDGDGDKAEAADEVIRQADDLVRGVGSLFDSIRGKEKPVPEEPTEKASGERASD
ncbi:hypothetical protein ACFQY0_07610 [Haloferula chungangensis]|uniref:DUF748 domain-containing protein n=1 Tax=Haloferula chungangensis TaxID=1048331 RepID=A0ABW2L3V6_9BACT